jgi:hypothetical protein
MAEKYNGKKRCHVLKGCSGDESIIQLKLLALEKDKARKKCRSRCLICQGEFNNEDAALQMHLKSVRHQNMEAISQEVVTMGSAIAFGGQQHREAVVDSYMVAYFIQRERLPHSTSEKLKKVLGHLHCTDSTKVERISMSRKTIARSNPFCVSLQICV